MPTETRQIGVPFVFKEDWKKLLKGDGWFLWYDPHHMDAVVLRRFNIPNVITWYMIQCSIKLCMKLFVPLLRLNERYWNYDYRAEGKYYTYIVDIYWKKPPPRICFFNMEYNHTKES